MNDGDECTLVAYKVMQAQIYAVLEKHLDVRICAKAGIGSGLKSVDQISMQKLGHLPSEGGLISACCVNLGLITLSVIRQKRPADNDASVSSSEAELSHCTQNNNVISNCFNNGQ